MEGVHRGRFGGRAHASAPGVRQRRSVEAAPAAAAWLCDHSPLAGGPRPTPRRWLVERRAEDAGHHRADRRGAEQAGHPRDALLTAEAIPASPSEPASTAAVSGATVSDRPSANTQLGGEHVGDVVDVVPTRWNRSSPAAATSGPSAHEQARPVAVGEHRRSGARAGTSRASPAASRGRSAAACSRRSAAGTGSGTGTGSPAPHRGRTSRRCRPRSSGAGTAAAAASVRRRRLADDERDQQQHARRSASPRQRDSPNPSRGCSISANTVPAEARGAQQGRAEEVDPPPCTLSRGRRDRDHDQPRQTSTSGTLIRNTALQSESASSSPPTSGPRIPAIAPHAVQVPIAAAPLLLGKRVDDHRQRARHQQRPRAALQRPRRHQARRSWARARRPPRPPRSRPRRSRTRAARRRCRRASRRAGSASRASTGSR